MSISSSLTALQAAKTDIANAITAKGGTVNGGDGFSDFATDVGTIPEGGAPVEDAPFNDVNFYDYDGTRLFSYTLAQANALTALPTPAGHDGLVFQEWNYTLAEVQSLIAPQDIGANYITDDGKTRLYIEVPTSIRKDVLFQYTQTVTSGVVVDWGDGSASQSNAGTGAKYFIHTYASPGEYCVEIAVNSGTATVGNGSYPVIGKTANQNAQLSRFILKECRIGSNMRVNASSFQNCTGLIAVSVPRTAFAGVAGNYAFSCCFRLKSLTIPRGYLTTGTYMFKNSVDYPSGEVAVLIPSTVTTVATYAFQYLHDVFRITIPRGVTSIANYALNGCYSVKEYYFLNPTPPALGGTSVFTDIATDCTIYVPVGSLTAYQTATNWSAHAAKMKEIGT